MTNFEYRQKGFTFVELSIVLVIVGMIVAGVAASLSLIKQSAIRDVITDFQNYKVSYDNFVNRYFQPPGDISNASTYWPDITGGTSSCATTAANCNGNGNELIESSNNEGRKAWRHLGLAGFITYFPVVINTTNNATIVVPDTAPTNNGATLGGYILAGYHTATNAIFNDATLISAWRGTGKNSVYLGQHNNSAGDTNAGLSLGALTPSDAFSVDQKIDDGMINSSSAFIGASTGMLRTINDRTVSAGVNDCITSSNNYQAGNRTSNGVTKCITGYQLN